MGNKNSINNNAEEFVSPAELKTLIMVGKTKLNLEKNKKRHDLKKHTEEIIDLIGENKIDIVRLKIELILYKENFIAASDILSNIFDSIKERVTYISKSKKCPDDLEGALQTLVYASTRLELDDFHQFREKISILYGQEFIEDAGKNKRGFVNPKIFKLLGDFHFPQPVVNQRLIQIAKENNMNTYINIEINFD